MFLQKHVSRISSGMVAGKGEVKGGRLVGAGVLLMQAAWRRSWLLPSRVSCVRLCPSLLLLLHLCRILLLLVDLS